MDEETNIQFSCTRDFKQAAKIAIMEKGIKNFQDGYLEIFKIGLENFKKQKGGKRNDN